MSSRLPRIPQNRVRRVTNLWAGLCEVAHTFVEKKADCYRVACYGRKVHLKHSMAAYICEISMGERRAIFAERCNSIGEG